jgi:hypothetical protein|tara:strand:- start:3285 stop:4760 length:1476 start_codon:yes stop_codon:yes gene_type:complete
MEIITECSHNNSYLNQTDSKLKSNESFQNDFNKKLKIAEYFDCIYNYPPKIKIKWETIDELKDDSFINSKTTPTPQPSHFKNFIEDFSKESLEEAISNNYLTSQYIEGFLNKINSSTFFSKKTTEIQSALNNIPVFAVINGHGQIILNKPSNLLGSKTITTYFHEKAYDSCGAFDPTVEKKSEVGLFFMNYEDAETYLKEVARSDFEGTQTVGLSIHCINLSSAYKITREYHPGIDFRFVPNFHEVKELLFNDIGRSDLLIEDEQQQLRFRYRNSNMFPYLKKLGHYLSPSSSFLQRNEYFKGIPIYIVQLNETPRNYFVEQYFNIVGGVDGIFSRVLQSVDHTLGFGQNWIMQGSRSDIKTSENSENYIFFEKSQALKFSKNNGRKTNRYNGKRGASLNFIAKKPKILVYNLEDFLEDWEDQISGELNNRTDEVEKIFQSKRNNFVSPTAENNEIYSYYNVKKTPLKDFQHVLDVKFRVFKRAVGVFFSI